ncbi:MAG: hypothetical protein M3M96_01600 [Candidatus Eremiobacteraeota bacterium]|nr:hypothetical protein [Candidatus Eremiobacteraeota bacterium]
MILARFVIVTAVAGCCIVTFGAPAAAVTAGPSCGMQVANSDKGISVRILFAKNGAVQRYEVVNSPENEEAVNDFRIALERQYGPAGVDAPPLRIVSFKQGTSGGMMMPDKAIDSCGRKLSFI